MITKKVFSDASYYRAERQPQLKADIEHAEEQITNQAATIAALEADKAKLIEALVKAESALTYANWDGEFDDTHTSQDVINARDEARRVLVEVTK